MVRKRAHAEKALTPPKEPSKRKNSRSSRISENSDPVASKKRKEHEDNDVIEEDGTLEAVSIKQPEVDLCEAYKNLPDHTTFVKELSDKSKGYWDSVQNDYHDFSNWTCLLQSITENEENIEASRAVYNCFLCYYPYCYGYWKKFADIERKSGNIGEAKKIFDRGVAAIPICVDLWVHYLNFSIQQSKDDQNQIRELFNRAINAAGLDFKSNKLWDAFIEWEKSLGNLKNVTEIFDSLIATPTQHYLKGWQKFRTHLEGHSPLDIIPTKEYARLVKDIDSLPPGMTLDDEESDNGDVNIIENSDSNMSDEAVMTETYKKMRSKILKERETLFLQTAEEIKKRLKYEEGIKRPYFHVKPLEKSQIKNWKEYLDYEIKEGDASRIKFLFERCMVVCALYETFWTKYLDYIELRDPDHARKVFQRACNIHLMKKYKLHLRWAAFEERHNNYETASQVLERIDHNFPGMILITQKRVGVARRMEKLDDAVEILKEAIQKSEMIEDKIFYSIKLSHVLAKFCKDKAQARDILWTALQLGKNRKRLYLQLLDLETHYDDVDSEAVKKLFTSVAGDMCVDIDFRESFERRKVEFYEEYTDDIDEIIEVENAYSEHQKMKQAERVTERLEKPMSNKIDSSKRSDIGRHNSSSAENNAVVHQAWYPPPPEGNNYYGWYGQQYQQ